MALANIKNAIPPSKHIMPPCLASVKLESVKRYWYKTKEILLLLPAEEREIEQEVIIGSDFGYYSSSFITPRTFD